MDPISNDVKQKLQEVSASVSSITAPHEVGNNDIRKLLQVFEELITRAPQPTQDLGQIKRILRETGPAIAFLEDHPGGPPGVH